MSNTFDKLSVLDSFIEEVNSYLPEIEANLNHLAQAVSDGVSPGAEVLDETYRRTHTIGGSASMMDFPGLAHVAHGMEDILGDVIDGVAPLDSPTLALLHRSLERMHVLVDGIRNGVDEEAIIAEDDADYTRYRTEIELAAQGSLSKEIDSGQEDGNVAQTTSAQLPEATIPSLDEMLESFRTPATSMGEEVDWPEEPIPSTPLGQDTQPRLTTSPEPISSETQLEPQQSALDVLIAASEQSIPQDTAPPSVTSRVSVTREGEQTPDSISNLQEAELLAEQAGHETVLQQATSPVIEVAQEGVIVGSQGNEIALQQQENSFVSAYTEMQEEAQVLEAQAGSLKKTLSQLRLAVSFIEAQRTEFRSFLDGSRDALERMEEWAGQAMGLNLRNSPEQVRRYLPLSVMWVANMKLKKVLDLLLQLTSNVEVTDEQMHSVLQQLQTSIETCGYAFEQLQANASAHLFTHEPGWTPWQMQVSPLRERVTFERHGDPRTMQAEMEAKLREELRREYESRPLSLALRAELEQQIRNEVREEFEAKRQLQESVSGLTNDETLREMEARLRSEVEIQVRQQFLSQLTGEEAKTSPQPVTSMPESAFTSTLQAPPVPQPAMPATSTLLTGPEAGQGGDFFAEAADLFRLEAEEHLQTISTHAAALENAPTDLEHIQSIRRATHTLKGAAGMMGFRAIADLCHISEDLLDSIMEGGIAVTSDVLSLILDTTEALDQLIHEKKSEHADNESTVQSLRPRYVELLGEQSALFSTPSEEEEEIGAEIEGNEVALIDTSQVTSVVADTSAAETSIQRGARVDLSVRVPLQKLDELVNLFGELLVNRSVLEERLQRLMRLVADAGVSSNRLRDVGQKLESRFEAATLPSGRSVQVMPGQGDQSLRYNIGGNGNHLNNKAEPSHLAEFDELELDRYTEFHQLARGLSEGISDMTTLSTEMEQVIRECESVFGRENRLNTTFQDRLMKARLVPLSTMTPRLYRSARAVALKQHKEFELTLEGQETEVDRTVIEEIAGPLLHLMRNAVNHGIETPEVRAEKGKPEVGQIQLSAAYEGNQVVITLRDDGAGIDPERVRKAAVSRGLIQPDQTLSDADLIDLIFRPGFSTAEVLSEESGRGVGLDVVRDSVSRLRGTLEVESTPGQGTAFTMKFPTSLAIQSTMMVQVGSQQFAIPTVMVEAIGRLDTYKHATYGGRPAILNRNEIYPVVMLAQLLRLPSSEPDEKTPLLLINTGRQHVAMVVDTIKGKMDVVMKNLGPHLRHVHGIAGGTVLGNGRVVLILEMMELLSSQHTMRAVAAGPIATSVPPESGSGNVSELQATARTNVETAADRRRITISPPPASPNLNVERGKHVLIVDDSPSVRRVVGNMLKQHGWEVKLARDGVEALEMITQETPAAVLLDIEMPRMDGYELMATVRAQEQYRTLPVVILTSRAAVKHQQRAMQLGANAYVVKPYQDEELINTLNTLVYGATVR